MRQLFTQSFLSLNLCAAALCAQAAPDPFARARAYSENSDVQRSWAASLLQDVELHPTDSILDYGSRDGRILALLRHRAPSGYHWGFEDDEELLAWAQAKYPTRLSHIHWSQELPSETGLFDHIISVNRLYREDDIQATLATLHKLLKPGGSLHSVGPGSGNMNALAQAFQRVIERLGLDNTGQASAGDPSLRDPFVMRELLEQAGFRVLNLREEHRVERFHDRIEAINWCVASLGIAWNLPPGQCQEICELAFEELLSTVPDAERPDGSLVLPMWRLEISARRN